MLSQKHKLNLKIFILLSECLHLSHQIYKDHSSVYVPVCSFLSVFFTHIIGFIVIYCISESCKTNSPFQKNYIKFEVKL